MPLHNSKVETSAKVQNIGMILWAGLLLAKSLKSFCHVTSLLCSVIYVTNLCLVAPCSCVSSGVYPYSFFV